MSLRALKTFLAIADRGSFAAAAKACHLTESAVSMQMKALEAELGIVLFDRSVRPPVLTRQALDLVARAETAVASYERLLTTEAGSGAVVGSLRLGAVPSLMSGLLPKALSLLARRHPDVHVGVTMGLSAELVERVRKGDLDAAVVSELSRPPRGLIWQPFLEEPLALAVPPDAPAGATVTELLTRYPFIRYTRQAWVGELIDELMKRRRLVVREAMTLDTLEAVIAMVQHGLGVSIIPAQAPAGLGTAPVRFVALPGPQVHRVVGLLYRPGEAERLATALLETLQQLTDGRNERRPRRRRGKS